MASMEITRVNALKAVKAGLEAAEAGKEPSECPFDPLHEDAGERFYAYYWMLGYTMNSPAPEPAPEPSAG